MKTTTNILAKIRQWKLNLKNSTYINEMAKINNSVYEEFYTFPLNMRTLQLYMLPKTHNEMIF